MLSSVVTAPIDPLGHTRRFTGFLQGCTSHHMHITGCCHAPPDFLHDDTYVCPAPSTPDVRGYDFFEGTQPLLSANRTTATDIAVDRSLDFIRRAAK